MTRSDWIYAGNYIAIFLLGTFEKYNILVIQFFILGQQTLCVHYTFCRVLYGQWQFHENKFITTNQKQCTKHNKPTTTIKQQPQTDDNNPTLKRKNKVKNDKKQK